MKVTKTKVLVAALAICLVAILSFGSLAWFTAEDSVTNEFYVGDTDTDPDDVFGIDLWEIVDGTEKGKGVGNTEGATYESILPGEKLSKVPYLTNTGIHPQFVRAIVTVTGADILKAAMTPKDSEVSIWDEVDLFLAGTNEKWTCEYKYYTNSDTFVFVYYYNEPLIAGGNTEALFNEVVIPMEMTLQQAQALDNFEINILGQAIQSEHLADPDAPGEMITTAKRAFEVYWDEEGVVAGVNLNEDLATENVAISYPVTGTLGTWTTTPISYDSANYTDPSMPGVLLMSDATATIKSGASLIDVPATVPNVTIYIKNTDLTIEEGSYFITSAHGTGQIILENVTINGEKVTYSNIDKWVTGFSTDNYNFMIG